MNILSRIKGIVGLLVVLIPLQCYAGNISKSEIVRLFVNEGLVVRDSGEALTEEYVSDCIQQLSGTDFKLECEGILFTHYIYQFDTEGRGEPVLLIVEDGASVENRWVYELQGDNFEDVTESTWPEISYSQVSSRLQQVTGDPRYTEDYVRKVAHSSYRVRRTEGRGLLVMSGIPDESRGTRLGQIRWDGNRFIFVEQ